MRLPRLLAALSVAAAALATAAPPAAAAPFCRVVKVGNGDLVWFGVCVDGEIVTNGQTFSGAFVVTCGVPPYVAPPRACRGTVVSFGPTGFVANPYYRAPDVDPRTGSVRVYDGSLGTLYVNGTAYDVPIVGFCVGDPTFCA